MFHKIKRLHFVGIGGSGMSGIAEVLLNLGYAVTGSDIAESDVTENLVERGATVFIGHSAGNVGTADVVVYSSAVKPDNVEVAAALDRAIPVIPRAEMLAELMRMKFGIAIAGTHGKSTTTSITGDVLSAGNLDPTIIVGGKVTNLGANVRVGMSEFLVAEADEFDRSFLKLMPTIAVVTTLEAEHMECYTDMDDLRGAFVEFMNKVPFYGAVILCLDEASLQSLLPEINRRVITYGLSTQSDLRATRIRFDGNLSKFEVISRGHSYGEIEMHMLGLHNVRNALAAIAVGLELGMEFAEIKRGIEGFRGVHRRFEIIGEANDIIVIDDFGHHPTEIRTTLQGAKLGYDRRVVAVFQPHLFSRTRDFAADFGQAFLHSDVLIVTGIYPSREDPIPGVTAELVYRAAKDYGHREVYYVPDKAEIPERLLRIAQPGDLVISFGAGDIWKSTKAFFELLKDKA
ncbi:MAG TPA: UDP-N-acetylmuramate--L-alanine ligase [candidate division Zixibacteria bacterium]|nr:UDP-N-acetylmuramate--L-alanine ligase [candidate division Zixibacteria bacterium]